MTTEQQFTPATSLEPIEEALAAGRAVAIPLQRKSHLGPLGLRFVYVDAEDYDRVMSVRGWYVEFHPEHRKTPHVRHRRIGYLHNFILGFLGVDHRNGNGLDNRKANLRPGTPTENSHNTGANSLNTTGFKGVAHHPSGKWQVRIVLDGRRKWVGGFDSIEEGARAYDKAVRAHYATGFARVNFPRPDEACARCKATGVHEHTEVAR